MSDPPDHDRPISPNPSDLTTVSLQENNELTSNQASASSPDSWWQRRHTLRLWWMEAASSCLVVAAFMAIIITVRVHQHKTLPKWPYELSINALIAVFTTIMKTAAGLTLAGGISHLKWTTLAKPRTLRNFEYHDRASRGPLGSLQLIWNNSIKDQSVSSLGALVTILLLLLEPFSQQIVRFYSCDLQRDNVFASIPRAQYHFVGTKAGAPVVRRAVNTGIYGAGTGLASFDCPTGNCTFTQEYHSIASCSSCKDLTEILAIRNYNITLSKKGLPRINITLPFRPEMGKSNLTWSRSAIRAPNTEFEVEYSFDDYYERFFAQYVRNYSGNGWTAMIRRSEEASNATYTAYGCTIYPCMKTYTASMSGGTLQEKTENQTDLDFEAFGEKNQVRLVNGSSSSFASFYSVVDLQCLNIDQKNILKGLNHTWDEASRWIHYRFRTPYGTNEDPFAIANNRTEGGKLSAEDSRGIPTRCMYTMSDTPFELLRELLTVKLNGTIEDSIDDTDDLYALYIAGSGNGTLQDFSSFFTNISDSLTTHIRQSGMYAALTEPARGNVYYSTTCVQVQWHWLIYAGVTTALFLVFFIGTILQTRRDQNQLLGRWKEGYYNTIPSMHDFKSSTLPLLYNGLDENSRRVSGTVGTENSEKGLEGTAKEVLVTMVVTDVGWQLSTTNVEWDVDKKPSVCSTTTSRSKP